MLTSCGVNVRLVGAKETDGAGVVPVPERVTVSGLFEASDDTVRIAVLAPAAIGEN